MWIIKKKVAINRYKKYSYITCIQEFIFFIQKKWETNVLKNKWIFKQRQRIFYPVFRDTSEPTYHYHFPKICLLKETVDGILIDHNRLVYLRFKQYFYGLRRYFEKWLNFSSSLRTSLKSSLDSLIIDHNF